MASLLIVNFIMELLGSKQGDRVDFDLRSDSGYRHNALGSARQMKKREKSHVSIFQFDDQIQLIKLTCLCLANARVSIAGLIGAGYVKAILGTVPSWPGLQIGLIHPGS